MTTTAGHTSTMLAILVGFVASACTKTDAAKATDEDEVAKTGEREGQEIDAPEQAKRERAPAPEEAPTPKEAPAPEGAPTALAVCQHITNLVKAQLPEEAAAISDEELRKGVDECVAKLETERETLGAAEYDKRAQCVMSASTMDALLECGMDEKPDPAPPTNEPEVEGQPTRSAVCQHVFDVIKAELGKAGTTPSEEDMRKGLDKCESDLQKEREKLGAAKYDEQVRCVMKASTMESLMKCDKGP